MVERVARRSTSAASLKVHILVIQNVMLQAAERVYLCASMLVGIMFDKEDSPFSNGVVLEATKKEVNEERLSRMLAQSLLDEEPTFVNYQDERVEIQIELSYAVTDLLFR